MANKDFYDVVLKDFAPKGFESLKGVVPGSTMAMVQALQVAADSAYILGLDSSNKDLTDEEKINRTLELKFTLDQIVQVKKELTQERQDLPSSDKDTLLTQKLLLQHLDDGLTNALDTTSFSLNVMGQRGMALGVGNFVAENAKAIGLLLYDTSILTEALDNDTRARNSARVEGISYLLTHWDELPDQVVNQLKKDITEASKKFDAGDYDPNPSQTSHCGLNNIN